VSIHPARLRLNVRGNARHTVCRPIFSPGCPGPSRLDLERYDRRTIALHWLTAILVVLLWTLGQTIDWFPKGLARASARSTHITLGLLLGLTVSYRLWWRLTAGRDLPRADPGWVGAVAVGVHRLLYLALITVVLLGIANAWIRGDNLFNLIAFPAYDTGNKELRGRIGDWHGLAANVLLVVAGLHAGAALFHRFVLRDRVLRRMTTSGPDR
jgi:cytochrome b561